jgi:hypothetical protein
MFVAITIGQAGGRQARSPVIANRPVRLPGRRLVLVPPWRLGMACGP